MANIFRAGGPSGDPVDVSTWNDANGNPIQRVVFDSGATFNTPLPTRPKPPDTSPLPSLANIGIGGVGGFLTGGPLGAAAGIVGGGMQPTNKPITLQSGLIDALKGALAGKAPGLNLGMDVAKMSLGAMSPQKRQMQQAQQQRPAQEVNPLLKLLLLKKLTPMLLALRLRNRMQGTV